jgi:hypothetical protein
LLLPLPRSRRLAIWLLKDGMGTDSGQRAPPLARFGGSAECLGRGACPRPSRGAVAGLAGEFGSQFIRVIKTVPVGFPSRTIT